jgi:predicted nuclease of predicted toxin-antitoxin system
VKFLIDMPLSPALATWLCERGHDAVHASELALDRSPDSDIIIRAKQEGRTIVTADLDYPHLLALARAVEPSVILFRDGDWSERAVIARMTEVLSSLADEDIEQSIVVVERDRLRRRRLPLKS